MPKSKSKRSTYTPPTPPNPKPSPRWLPRAALGLIGIGTVLLLLVYFVPALPGGDANLFVGFIIMSIGLVMLSRWR